MENTKQNPNLTRYAQANWVATVCFCGYCGEEIPKTTKLCTICRKKEGRQGILDANKLILTELRAKGYCKEQVLLPAV